jgi:hypothetical protein
LSNQVSSLKTKEALQREVEQLRQELLYQQHRHYLEIQRALDRQLEQLTVRRVVQKGPRYDLLLPIIQTVTDLDGVTVYVGGKR